MSNIIGIRNNNAIIPYVSTTKRTKQIELTVTSAQTGWNTTRAVGIFYADSNNVWRLRFNLRGTFTSASIDTLTIALSNVVFKAGFYQAVSAYFGTASTALTNVYVNPGTSSIVMNAPSASTQVEIIVSGDVELNAEPKTYTTAANMEGVIAADVWIPPASATQTGLVDTGAQTFAGVKTFSNGISLGNETLSVYDEGVWTPVPTSSSGTITSYTSSGKYVKVGKLVTIAAVVTITNNGTGSGYGVISGLPFPIDTALSISSRAGGTTGLQLNIYGTNGQSSMEIREYDNDYPWSTNTVNYISGSYLTT